MTGAILEIISEYVQDGGMDTSELTSDSKPSVPPHLWRSCLAWIEEGRTLVSWCLQHDVSADRVYRHIRRGEDEGRPQAYARARENGIAGMLETMVTIGDNATPETVAVDRLRIDARRYAANAWIAARAAAKGNGGAQVQVTVSTGVPRVGSQSTLKVEALGDAKETDPGGGRPSASDGATGEEEPHIPPTHTSIPPHTSPHPIIASLQSQTDPE